MANKYNLTGLTVSGYTNIHDHKGGNWENRETGIRTRLVDFARLANPTLTAGAIAGTAATGVTTFTANDLIGVLPVFKGEFVRWVAVYVHSADTTTTSANISLGDALTGSIAASDVGWLPTFDLKSAAGTVGVSDGAAATFYLYGAANSLKFLGKFYSADGTIDLKLLGTTAATWPKDAIIEVSAMIEPAFPHAKIPAAQLATL